MDNTNKTPPVKSDDTVKSANKYDELNEPAMNIFETKGSAEAVKFMFNPTGDKQLS